MVCGEGLSVPGRLERRAALLVQVFRGPGTPLECREGRGMESSLLSEIPPVLPSRSGTSQSQALAFVCFGEQVSKEVVPSSAAICHRCKVLSPW